MLVLPAMKLSSPLDTRLPVLQAVLDREHEFRFLAVQPVPLEDASGAIAGTSAADTAQPDSLAVGTHPAWQSPCGASGLTT